MTTDKVEKSGAMISVLAREPDEMVSPQSGVSCARGSLGVCLHLSSTSGISEIGKVPIVTSMSAKLASSSNGYSEDNIIPRALIKVTLRAGLCHEYP